MGRLVYRNPIAADMISNIRDPFILREGGRYYLTGTFPPYWTGESKGVMLYRSDDLLHWTRIGCILSREQAGADDWFRDYWWAPEIHKKDGRFYLTVNCRNDARGVGQNPLVAVSDCIDGAYEMLNANAPFFTQRLTEKTGFDCTNGNDANLFTDVDGKTYISVCNFGGIYAYEIDLPSCQLQGEPIRIVEPSLDGWDTKNEGQFVIRRGARYYCFFSSFTRSYEVGVATAERMRGPWKKDERNPIVSPRGSFVQSGHNCIFTGPDGEWWMAYHVTVVGEDDTQLLAIDKIGFDAQGRVITGAPTDHTVTVEW